LLKIQAQRRQSRCQIDEPADEDRNAAGGSLVLGEKDV
jgi:hypothetical protein